MRPLIIGGDSKIGKALCTRLIMEGRSFTRTTRRAEPSPLYEPDLMAVVTRTINFDLLDPKLPKDLDVDVVYIIAAVTGFAAASSHPDAWRVNAEAPLLIAQQACERGWHIVQLSSGAVERAQETAYARQKSWADLMVLMCGGCVVRPLSTVTADRLDELAQLLLRVGDERHTGIVRWGA